MPATDDQNPALVVNLREETVLNEKAVKDALKKLTGCKTIGPFNFATGETYTHLYFDTTEEAKRAKRTLVGETPAGAEIVSVSYYTNEEVDDAHGLGTL